MADMTVEYRDFEIKFYNDDNRWSVDIDNVTFYDEDIKVLKKKIAAFHKGKVAGITALVRGGGYGLDGLPFQAVRITSITEDGDIWATYVKTGRRERLYRHATIYMLSAKNKKAIVEYMNLTKAIEKLQDRKSKLVERMELMDLTKYGVPGPKEE